MPPTIAKRRLSERLSRLASSWLCPEGYVEENADDLKQLVDKIIDTKHINKQNRLLKALANPTRLEVLNLLQIREMCVCEIMVALGLTQPTASHHLNILENADVVKDRKEGRWVFYSLTSDAIKLLFESLNRAIE